MSLSKSLTQLEQAFRELQDNFEKSVTVLLNAEQSVVVLQEAVRSVTKTALSDDKTPLRSALALERILSSTSDERSFDVVIFGDLNRFKPLNDNYGHAAGDYAIRVVGTMIQTLFVDKYQAQAFRPHGDEFIILLKREFLESLKTHVIKFAKCEFEFEEQPLKTAMSFGAAVRQGETDFETLRARAEAACQKAKRQGDGVLIEWSEQIEMEKTVEFRKVQCEKCGTEHNCYVPANLASEDSKLRSCSWCGNQL